MHNYSYSSFINGSFNGIKIHTISSNLGYFIIGKDTTTSKIIIWKFLFNSSPNTECKRMLTIDQAAKGQLILSDSELFVLGYYPTFPYPLLMYKYTFGNTSLDWANQMTCSGSGWLWSNSASLLFNNQILTFFSYGSTLFVYFVAVSASSGTVMSSRYRSSTSWSNVYGISQSGKYVVATVYWTPSQYLVILNTDTFQFTSKQFSGSYLYQVAVEPTTAR